MADTDKRKNELREERLAKADRDARRLRLRRRGAYAVGALIGTGLAIAAVLLLFTRDDQPGRSAAVLPQGGTAPRVRKAGLETAAKEADCDLQRVRIRNRSHVKGRVRYPMDPPSGGNHSPVPAEDGAYEQAPATEKLVHALEHGRIVLWFKRALSQQDRATLFAYFDSDNYQTLLAPDQTKARYALAATAWSRNPAPLGTGRLLGCHKVTERTYTAMAAFRDRYRGNGPEAVP